MACAGSIRISSISITTTNPKPNRVLQQLQLKLNKQNHHRQIRSISMSKDSVTLEKSGVKIHRNPPESILTQLGVRQWPKWGCSPSKFPWTYDSEETCYLLEGKVKVFPEGSDEAVEIGAGDLVVFPRGMSCTWDVSVAVDKHYKFQ